MRKVLIVILATLAITILSVNSVAQSDVQVKYFQMKYLGFDRFNNGYKLSVNISINEPGSVTYIEEYYNIDSNNNPRLINTRRFYGGETIPFEDGISFNVTFEILRPPAYTNDGYRLIKSIILVDDKRIFEKWLTKNIDFDDNTASPEDGSALTEIQNIDKYEIREKNMVTNLSVTFVYSTLGIIYEVNVTGSKNRELSLKVEQLKGRSSLTYKPDGIIYKYINIIADNENIKEISIKYKIERSWIKDNNIDKLGLLTWDGINKKWLGSSTKLIANDSEYLYFESTSTGPSQFAIVGIPKPTINNNVSKTNNTQNGTNTNNTSAKANIIQINQTNQANLKGKEPLIRNIPGFESILAIVILILLSKRRK